MSNRAFDDVAASTSEALPTPPNPVCAALRLPLERPRPRVAHL
jgi:hypothetical protein